MSTKANKSTKIEQTYTLKEAANLLKEWGWWVEPREPTEEEYLDINEYRETLTKPEIYLSQQKKLKELKAQMKYNARANLEAKLKEGNN